MASIIPGRLLFEDSIYSGADFIRSGLLFDGG